jgi:thiol-disulfide isomerase/thioredoxin
MKGTKLENFALRDLDGQTWEFRNNTGRLVLLDFWATWCVPCRKALPEVQRLHSQYGGHGLEVVGIACDSPTESKGRAEGVRDVVAQQHLGYRQLISRQPCPVQRAFIIDRIPTLVLLDHDGRVLWTSQGQYRMGLEETIRSHLGNKR